MCDKNQSIQALLTKFIKDGGVVLMCQACSAAAGLNQADVFDRDRIDDWPTVSGYLFDPAIKTLSW